MARLIDADALMDVIRQHEYRLATKQGAIDYGMFTLGIQQAVDEQPTVDAVEVVRCKDCKHQCKIWHADKRMKEKGYWIYSCKRNSDQFVTHTVNGYDDEYCCYPERKEVENDE